jgi:aminoglycoside phosphotransferase (APT) family kinase protein
MTLLNVQSLLEATFADEPGLAAKVQDVRFLQRGLFDTYLVEAADGRFVAQISRDGLGSLIRLKRNLGTLRSLDRPHQLPALLAWRQGDDPELEPWAVAISSYIPGDELSPSTLNRKSWTSLCGLLEAVHRLPAKDHQGRRLARASDGPGALSDVAVELERQVPKMGWPVSALDVRPHLREIDRFVDRHGPAFEIAPCFIHGDLSRANIRISNGAAGLVDWADGGYGDYAYDLGCLKFALDSVAPRASPKLIQELARHYRQSFDDQSLELRLAFYLAFTGLAQALAYALAPATFNVTRAMRVRACLLHSIAQWRSPLRLDGPRPGAPASITDHSWLRLPTAIPRPGSQLN